ncbi:MULTISPECIES: hypothetical protein [Halomonas]|uniref:Uncharacterized protein n=1 Tax=Halomonas flagellata TaxID=2920385 RepID=A0ABS9RQ52_9GAMM|nr:MULTISPECIES: hypothetical protein [Halomonas]MCH4561965.1 hypothetical protein [Halomonas flagellata]
MTTTHPAASRCPNAAHGVMVAGRGGEGRDDSVAVGRRYWFGYWFSTGVPVAMS